ncbi:hypothetical protein LguiA_033938 [Lonicera macranthoides]
MNVQFLDNTNLSDSYTNLKPLLLRRSPETRFLHISGTCRTFSNVRVFPEVKENSTVPLPSTFARKLFATFTSFLSSVFS